MKRHSGTIFCLAYIIGLFSTAFLNWLWLIFLWVIITVISLIIIPKIWRFGIRQNQLFLAGLIAIIAVVYFQFRLPTPTINDISHQIDPQSKSEFLTVKGKILTEPRITRSDRFRFWFEPTEVENLPVTGKLYVTIPLDEGYDLYSGQKITIKGILYKPSSANNPGGFDFAAYLAKQGSFAGLKGFKVYADDTDIPWGISTFAKKIIEFQNRGLGSPEGALVSSMVIGAQRVDLPYNIKDKFILAGLAHILAASGFQVSFLLGLVLSFTRRFPRILLLIIGLFTLAIYISLTGIQPSVMRAGVMGVAVLIATVSNRKIKPFGSLLLAATLLLLFNPIWIRDLGFQLSFLATLGLIVTLPVLEKQLDWLPDAIATTIAIPIAACLWTLPLLMYTFSTVAIYSIPINVISAPLVTIISLGGMISATLGLIWQDAGSAIARVVYYPTHLLINLVDFFVNLHLTSTAVGRIPLGVLLLIYSLFVLVWLNRWWQRRWWLVGLFSLSLIIIPFWHRQSAMQVTVLAAKEEQVIIIQDQGKTTLINGGEEDTIRYNLLPFFAYQGINHIDCLIRLKSETTGSWGWSEIDTHTSILEVNKLLNDRIYQPLEIEKPILIGSTEIKLISQVPPILQVQIQGKNWLLIGSTKAKPNLQINVMPEVIIWSGKTLKPEWIEALQPKIAIAASPSVQKKTQELLQQKQIKLYWPYREGALRWTPESGFQILATEDNIEFF